MVDKLLTRTDIKNRYKISDGKAQELMYRSDFPSFKLDDNSRKWYIRETDLIDWERRLCRRKRF